MKDGAVQRGLSPTEAAQRASEIAGWLKYQAYLPSAVRETLELELARLHLLERSGDSEP